MIDTAHSRYPADMMEAAHGGRHLEVMAEDLIESIKRYAEEKPSSALLWAFGIGFVLGWKLKPW